jgi:hypothetical protein
MVVERDGPLHRTFGRPVAESAISMPEEPLAQG